MTEDAERTVQGVRAPIPMGDPEAAGRTRRKGESHCQSQSLSFVPVGIRTAYSCVPVPRTLYI